MTVYVPLLCFVPHSFRRTGSEARERLNLASKRACRKEPSSKRPLPSGVGLVTRTHPDGMLISTIIFSRSPIHGGLLTQCHCPTYSLLLSSLAAFVPRAASVLFLFVAEGPQSETSVDQSGPLLTE